MVSRADLERLKQLDAHNRRAMGASVPLVLWDSDPISEVIDMPTRPLAFPPHGDFGVLMSDRLIRASKIEAVRWRDGDYFAPQTYMYFDNGEIGVSGAEYLWQPDRSAYRIQTVVFRGTPYEGGEAIRRPLTGGDLVTQVPDEGTWNAVSRMAQAVQYCVTYPKQFPLLRTRLTPAAERNKSKRREIVRAALPEVNVIELRPRRYVERPAAPGTAGERREFRYSFRVRGHWRHYPDGRTVWQPEYWKAVDKPRVERQKIFRF